MGQRLGAVLPIVVIRVVTDFAVDILLDVEIVLALRGVRSGVGHRIDPLKVMLFGVPQLS
tara:strand:- start:55 stop:234 length:180 start_codon:yes stop_codon:yes gene_type:complete